MRIKGYGEIINTYFLDDDGTEELAIESELKGTLLKITTHNKRCTYDKGKSE